VRLEGLGQLKEINLIGTLTRDLPACSIVPQTTTLPRALPSFNIVENRKKTFRKLYLYPFSGEGKDI
jgi:hypothetical protein